MVKLATAEHLQDLQAEVDQATSAKCHQPPGLAICWLNSWEADVVLWQGYRCIMPQSLLFLATSLRGRTDSRGEMPIRPTLHRPKVRPICFTFESICHGSQGRSPHQSERHADICPYRQQIRMRRLCLCACSARPSDALVSICYARSKQIAFLSGLGVSNSSPAATPLPDNLIRLVITPLLDHDKCV
ncbi:uncharacterized [Tachysurus ichikawai]